MENTTELNYLRSRREAEIAMRDLEAEAANVAKRYKKGVKALAMHVWEIDKEIDGMTDVMPGMSALDTMDVDLKRLVADPTLDNIRVENNV